MTAVSSGLPWFAAAQRRGVFARSRTMSRALVEQMAFSADATAARLPALQAELSNVLVQYKDDRLVNGVADHRTKALNQLGWSAPQFSQVFLVSANGQVSGASGAIANGSQNSGDGSDPAEIAGFRRLSDGQPQMVAPPLMHPPLLLCRSTNRDNLVRRWSAG
ncbi:MAG: hypothetical protein R3C44_18985 [Chloroflexota bacterium]